MKNVLAKVVMLATEKATDHCITKSMTSGKLFYNSTEKFARLHSTTEGAIIHHLFFTTDEEIKDGDWAFCYDVHNSNPLHLKKQYINPVRKHTGGNCSACKKIVSSTDDSLGLPRPSNEFLKAYCEQGGIDEVFIQYTRKKLKQGYGIIGWYDEPTIRIAPDNTITIHPVKQKESWSRDEVINKLHQLLEEIPVKGYYSKSEFDNWLKQNLK